MLRQSLHGSWLGPQSIGNHLLDFAGRERTKLHLQRGPASGSHRVQDRNESVVRSDFVVSECADEQEIRDILVCGKAIDELDRRGIQPLQIVDEENERPTGRGKHSQ